MGAELLGAISRLGLSSFGWFWVPVAHWTALAIVALLGLGAARSCHPLTGYRLRQALLVSLPLVVLLAPWSPRLVPGFGLIPALTPTLGADRLADTVAGAGVRDALASAVSPGLVTAAPTVDPTGVVLGLATLLAVALAALQLVLLVRQLRDLRTLRSFTTPMEDREALGSLVELSQTLGVGRPVQLLEGPEDVVPLTFHVRRPAILIPGRLSGEPDRLRAVLAHELVHVRRGDAAWTLLERLVSVPFSFHPLVWLLARRIERLREASCDAEVVGSGVAGPRTYAELLYDMNSSTGRQPSVVPTFLTRTSKLRERVESMKQFAHTPPDRRIRRRSAFASVILLALTVVAGACGSGAPSAEGIGADLAAEMTSRFGPMADETRDAALERLDVQMSYLQERVEEVAAQIREVELSGLDPHPHMYEQYQLLSQMYLQRLETYETLKLERETELRLGQR